MDICEYRIRYLEPAAGKHRIALGEFCKSLQGFAGVFTAIGSELLHQKITVETDARLKPGSVEISSIISSALQAAPDLEAARQLFAAALRYLYGKGEKTDMEPLLDYLKSRDELDAQKYTDTLRVFEKALNKNARASVVVIGSQCQGIEIDADNGQIVKLDRETKSRIFSRNDETVTTEEQELEIVFCEMELEKRSCKYYLADDYQFREDDAELAVHRAGIRDPDFDVPGNAYISAFSEQKPLRVSVKIQKSSAGSRYFIMDTL